MERRQRYVHNGFSYQINRRYGSVYYYRCSLFRKTNCQSKLIRRESTIEARGTHTCDQSVLGAISFREDANVVAPADFANDFVKNASKDLKLFPFQIYEN